MSEDAALKKGVEFRFDKLGQPRPGLGFDLDQEGFEVFLDQLVEDGVFGTSALVVDAPLAGAACTAWSIVPEHLSFLDGHRY